jgi:acyl carrier protein
MLPTALLPVGTIPLTSHGKVDQKALPPVNLQTTQSYIAPRNDIEANICSLMATVLELEKVGIADDFWEIGGDSLKITQLVTHLRETYQVDLPLSQVFSHRTPQELAQLITTATVATSNKTITKSRRQKKTVQLSNDGILFTSR